MPSFSDEQVQLGVRDVRKRRRILLARRHPDSSEVDRAELPWLRARRPSPALREHHLTVRLPGPQDQSPTGYALE